ncbi:MAG: helix-turn-helix domain-containing protein [Sphingomonadaceae bacterium]
MKFGVPRISKKQDLDGRLVSIGDAIRALRAQQGMSQEELASRSGIDRGHMGRLERGERNLSILNLFKVAEGLGVKPSDILTHVGF